MSGSFGNWGVLYFLEVLDHITGFVTSCVDWVLEFLSVIQSSPVLFVFVVVVPLVGLGIGLLNRLIRAN